MFTSARRTSSSVMRRAIARCLSVLRRSRCSSTSRSSCSCARESFTCTSSSVRLDKLAHRVARTSSAISSSSCSSCRPPGCMSARRVWRSRNSLSSRLVSSSCASACAHALSLFNRASISSPSSSSICSSRCVYSSISVSYCASKFCWCFRALPSFRATSSRCCSDRSSLPRRSCCHASLSSLSPMVGPCVVSCRERLLRSSLSRCTSPLASVSCELALLAS
mmetsp:Transcript_23489/g.38797  ORF Transcript_23489/g.38797 Transcript_23489/m.38797 type:complete len:222 (+) Transcript_23489:287-952(+)